MQSGQSNPNAWDHFLSLMANDLETDEVEAWLDSLTLNSIAPEKVVLSGINHFFSVWIRDHHQSILRSHLLTTFSDNGLKPDFKLVIQPGVKESSTSIQPLFSDNQAGELLENGLDSNFQFKNFINGTNSDIAYAAARAVGDNITENKYNPLFICGDVGLGKTHLIQAIGLQVRRRNKNIKILYSSSKEFTNEVVDGIRFGRIQQVRDKYRHVDLLLIDDIQFLENKERTQEEFFHTFNELIQNKKQIILTADRYPREIKKLEERLVNRFNSGMVAKIYPPDFETRVAIIQLKVDKMKLPLNEDLIETIADAVKSNVRDIEGILIHIEAKWSLLDQDITPEMVKIVLKEVLNIEKNPKTIDSIIKAVSIKFNVKINDIKSNRRDKETSKSRQIAMYITREMTGLSFPVIGKNFGGKNHTSVLQACKKTKQWIESDPEIKQVITSLIRELS